MEVKVIGAGLAGSEAALQLSKRGIKVELYEMRPVKTTGAHKTDKFAEFVCSNSLGASDCTNASGLLKKEMELLGGELIQIARKCSVPAGNALAIDRELFSQTVTERIVEDPNIEVIREEVEEIPEEAVECQEDAGEPVGEEHAAGHAQSYGDDHFRQQTQARKSHGKANYELMYEMGSVGEPYLLPSAAGRCPKNKIRD